MSSLCEIGQVVLEKKIILNFINVYLLFHNYLPLEMGVTFHLNKLESPSLVTQGCIVLSLVEIGPFVQEQKIFKNFINEFYYFLIIYPWKRTGPLIYPTVRPTRIPY